MPGELCEGYVVYPLYISLKGRFTGARGEEVRRVRLCDTSFEGMKEVVGQWVGGSCRVRYVDDDGDEVEVGSAVEWQECARSFLERGSCVRLKLMRGKPVRGTNVSPECLSLDDQWGAIASLLHRELGMSPVQKLAEAKCIPLSWVINRESYLLISRRYLREAIGRAETPEDITPQPPLSPVKSVSSVGVATEVSTPFVGVSVGTNAVATVECTGTSTEAAMTSDISVGTYRVSTCDAMCSTLKEPETANTEECEEDEEEEEEDEEDATYSYEAYEEPAGDDDDYDETSTCYSDDVKDADDSKGADASSPPQYTAEIQVMREMGITEPEEVIINMLEEMKGNMELAICALL
eukprot:TRINITY_DN2395_c0_g3_i1.p1 TRINITY_DN2395_c0_g3~~TRINITY_DN2395_c0_g3_i1.p1  ORF type:complete len:351 (+),score=68.55 TRINITY_DN2395_c0_g3_i1:71-1123(+)